MREKVKPLKELKEIINREKQLGKQIVFTNGCFDILHIGHIRYLEAAKNCGHILVVAVNSDDSVRGLKGKERPLIPEQERAEVLAGLQCVDYVVIFAEPDPVKVISQLIPNVLVKGGDYQIEGVLGREIVEANGGKVIIVPLVEGRSTTNLVKQIQLANSEQHVQSRTQKIVALIPARYSSSRFPGKPLAEIRGKPMIQRVYERACLAKSLAKVIVATDDQRIYQAVTGFGGRVVMTSPKHQSGTERLAEATKDLDADIVVNIQGDEPLIQPEMIEEAISPLLNEPQIVMSTLKQPITDSSELNSPDVVKVVTDKHDFALYFSRCPIPHNSSCFKHIGLYVYRKNFLMRLVSLEPTPLEMAERLEQLRALENGYKIKVVQTEYLSIAVDRPEDLEKVKQFF